MVSISSATVEKALALVCGIAPDKRVAFRGRIKRFQRMQFPGGTNTGQGRTALFSFNQFLKLLFAFELVQSGLSPSSAASVIEAHWSEMRMAAARTLIDDDSVEYDPMHFADGNLVFGFQIDAMWSLTVDGPVNEDIPDYFGSFRVFSRAELSQPFSDPKRSAAGTLSPWRVLLIDVRPLVWDVATEALRIAGFSATKKELFDDLVRG
ncbi:MAG TPA: hypothetical protein VJ846_04455, partial [Sphingomicrobium sp.]|nr:hypothetical protein [Sphingomicrobium sp.]